MAHGKGCKRSDQAKLDATIDARHHPQIRMRLAMHVTGAEPLPSTSNPKLVTFDPFNVDQGRGSYCTCASTLPAVACAMGVAGLTPFLGSFHCAYSDSGRIENPTGKLQDDGRQIADVMTAIQSGMAPFEGNAPDGRFSDIWTADDLQAANLTSPPPNVCMPSSTAEKAAEVTCSFGQHTIDMTAPDALDVCAATLQDAPIEVGTWVGPAFENATPSSVVRPETQDSAPSGGGHALRVIGYRPAKSAKGREWLVSNSWSKEWCASGRVWVTDAWLLGCFEAWAMNVTVKGAPCSVPPPPSTQPAPPSDPPSGPGVVDLGPAAGQEPVS